MARYKFYIVLYCIVYSRPTDVDAVSSANRIDLLYTSSSLYITWTNRGRLIVASSFLRLSDNVEH